MALSTRLDELDKKKTKRPGVVQNWLDSLSDSDRSLVLSYMSRDNSEVSHRSLLEALKDEGAPFGKEALTAFRRDLWKSNVNK